MDWGYSNKGYFKFFSPQVVKVSWPHIGFSYHYFIENMWWFGLGFMVLYYLVLIVVRIVLLKKYSDFKDRAKRWEMQEWNSALLGLGIILVVILAIVIVCWQTSYIIYPESEYKICHQDKCEYRHNNLGIPSATSGDNNQKCVSLYNPDKQICADNLSIEKTRDYFPQHWSWETQDK